MDFDSFTVFMCLFRSKKPDTDVQGRFPTCRTQRTHMKNAKKVTHASIKSALSLCELRFPHFRVRALRILVF